MTSLQLIPSILILKIEFQQLLPPQQRFKVDTPNGRSTRKKLLFVALCDDSTLFATLLKNHKNYRDTIVPVRSSTSML